MNNNNNHQITKPFLRWAGGKTRSIQFLVNHLPSNFSNGNKYFEPFLGAGSLFFYLNPSKAILSDNNKDLIECYKAIQKNPALVSKYLKNHHLNNCKNYYYKMREKYNFSDSSYVKAALFIYLNKTCFNGIWRVNNEGKFNVPYGYKEPPSLPTKDELFNISRALLKARIIQRDYKAIIKYIQKGDFVYFDPPYPPLNGTSFFTHYTKERFSKENHADLVSVAKILKKKGCYILISNADTSYIRSLFEDDFNIFELEVIRWIRTDGTRYKVKEIAITNY